MKHQTPDLTARQRINARLDALGDAVNEARTALAAHAPVLDAAEKAARRAAPVVDESRIKDVCDGTQTAAAAEKALAAALAAAESARAEHARLAAAEAAIVAEQATLQAAIDELDRRADAAVRDDAAAAFAAALAVYHGAALAMAGAADALLVPMYRAKADAGVLLDLRIPNIADLPAVDGLTLDMRSGAWCVPGEKIEAAHAAAADMNATLRAELAA